jgi:peptide deformylase
MVLPIVHYNDSILRKKGVKVTTFDAALAKLANDMIETMHDARGIGLAAQQIGLALQLCVVDLSEADWDFNWELDGTHTPLELIMPMVIANPEVKKLPSPETLYEEGCLSFPKIRGDVPRPDAISVKFQDANGTPHTLICDGMFARCIQHENDHLNGVLFIDRMEKKVRAGVDKAVKDLAKVTKDKATAAAKK